MTGHTSHNAPPRGPSSAGTRSRYGVLCLLSGLVFVAAVLLAVDKFPDTEMGRTIEAHLTQLADPESWIQ
jgi:hypothetical protein